MQQINFEIRYKNPFKNGHQDFIGGITNNLNLGLV